MGSGNYGEFGKTKGSRNKTTKNDIKLPLNDSQLKHIFRNSEGHLKDTEANRKILVNLANNDKYFKGTDMYGIKWNVKINSKGEQLWVRYDKNKINDGGKNIVPRRWDKNTGLNKNPFRKKGDK